MAHKLTYLSLVGGLFASPSNPKFANGGCPLTVVISTACNMQVAKLGDPNGTLPVRTSMYSVVRTYSSMHVRAVGSRELWDSVRETSSHFFPFTTHTPEKDSPCHSSSISVHHILPPYRPIPERNQSQDLACSSSAYSSMFRSRQGEHRRAWHPHCIPHHGMGTPTAHARPASAD